MVAAYDVKQALFIGLQIFPALMDPSWHGQGVLSASVVHAAVTPNVQAPAVLGRKERNQRKSRRIVTLAGFANTLCNGQFFECFGDAFSMHGRETYWSDTSLEFLYWHRPSNCWRVAMVEFR